jgi:hypothetical protein
VLAAAQLDVLGRGRAAERVRLEVMELQEPRFAAPALAADERAAPLVPAPDGTADGCGNATRSQAQQPRPDAAD